MKQATALSSLGGYVFGVEVFYPATEHTFIRADSGEPKHGTVHDHHYENEAGQRVHVFGGGALQSVCHKYCAGCKKWIRVEGVMGNLRFMADHPEQEHES
jgi:hypothetical protein